MNESANSTVPVPRPLGEARPEAPKKLWTYKEVANLCRVSVRTLMNWVKAGMIPPPRRFGYSSRYGEEEVASILQGPSLPETFSPTPSPREKSSRKGGKATAKKAKGKHPSRIAKPTRSASLNKPGDRNGRLVKKGAK